MEKNEREIKISYPTLYKKTTTGVIQKWDVCVELRDEIPTIVNNYGQVDGKIQESSEQVLEGKNIGRANATTAIEQARAQAKSRWDKQKKKGYVENIEDALVGKTDDVIEGGIFPMLAHKFSEQGHKIKYPALAQPKLDGHRCTSQCDNIQDICSINNNGQYGDVSLWSRTRKIINSVPHINKALSCCGITNRFDGELYNHDYHNNFEELSSLIRQDEPTNGYEIIQFHVYDFPHPTMKNGERNTLLQSYKPIFENTPIHIVETIIVNNEDELMEAFEHFLTEGYEGCMVRNIDGLYVNKRSYDLQKIKEFDDSEFEIIGVKVGTKGCMAGKAVFICKLNEKNTFDCKMKGNMDDLKKYADDPTLVIGKLLTVKYQGFTKYGVPRFPVGLRFRDDI